MSRFRRTPEPTAAEVKAFLRETNPGLDWEGDAARLLHTMICWLYCRERSTRTRSEIIVTAGRFGLPAEKCKTIIGGELHGASWGAVEALLMACCASKSDLQVAQELHDSVRRSRLPRPAVPAPEPVVQDPPVPPPTLGRPDQTVEPASSTSPAAETPETRATGLPQRSDAASSAETPPPLADWLTAFAPIHGPAIAADDAEADDAPPSIEADVVWVVSLPYANSALVDAPGPGGADRPATPGDSPDDASDLDNAPSGPLGADQTEGTPEADRSCQEAVALPDPDKAATAAEFVQAMKDYREYYGDRPYREMQKRSDADPRVDPKYSHTSFCIIGRNGRLPKRDLVIAYIVGAGPRNGTHQKTLDRWARAHLRLTRLLASPPDSTNPDSTTAP